MKRRLGAACWALSLFPWFLPAQAADQGAAIGDREGEGSPWAGSWGSEKQLISDRFPSIGSRARISMPAPRTDSQSPEVGMPSIPNLQSYPPSLTTAPQDPLPDPWFGPDKVRHFFTSALVQSLGYGALRAVDVEHGAALASATVITSGFGLGKELHDRRRGYGFSVRDLVWDAAGAAAISVLLAHTER